MHPTRLQDAKADDCRQRWQRVLAAYLALRALRTYDGSTARTPVIGRVVATIDDLEPGDLTLRK